MTIGPVSTHCVPVSQKSPFLEIKVIPSAEQKRLFKAAADAAKPFPLSLNKWLILAGMEKAERDGVVVPPPKRKGGR